jgi:hypothetical protein
MAILKIKDKNGKFINIPSIIGKDGEKGEQGIQGIQGEKGDKGDIGDTGYTLTNTLRGESVAIEDAVEFKLFNLEIDGKSVQETRSGKNKLEFIIANQTVNGLEIINNNDGSLTLNGTTTNSVSMQFSKTMNNLVAGDYYLSMNPTGTVSTNFTKIIYGRQNTTTAIELANTSMTDEKSFTTNTDYNYYYLWLYIKSGITFTNYVIRPQLENGTTFTGWECYGATPTPNIPSEIESLGTYNETTSKYGIEVKVTNGTDTKTTVLALNEPLRSVGETKDIAYIKNNKLYVDRYVGRVFLNGTEGWNINSGVGFHTSALQGNVKNIGKAISNRYVYDKWTWQGNYTFSINSTGILAISDNTYSSVADFKTWLSNNNVQVDYELATPITEEVGDCVIYTYEGVNNIDLEANLKTEFSVTYAQDMKSILKDYPSMEEVQQYVDSQLGSINEQLASLTEVE